MNSTRDHTQQYDEMCREKWNISGAEVSHARPVWNFRDEIAVIAAGWTDQRLKEDPSMRKFRLGTRQRHSLRQAGIFVGSYCGGKVNMDRVEYLLNLPCVTLCIDPEAHDSEPSSQEEPPQIENQQVSHQ